MFLAPSQFEAAFVSLAHSEEDLDAAARACRGAMEKPLAGEAQPKASRADTRKEAQGRQPTAVASS